MKMISQCLVNRVIGKVIGMLKASRSTFPIYRVIGEMKLT
jgi:hypothetical protein